MESDMSISAPSDGLSDGVQRIRPLHGRTSGPARRSTKGQWTAEEDEILRNAVQRFKGKNWKKIAECFKDRTDVQCLHRWQKVLNPELVKGPWLKEEDEIIIELVNKYGPKKWSTIAQHLPGRIGKQCRERWHNHLNPAINKEAWTQQEEVALIRAHQIYGNRWAELTKFLPGRTDNAIKNHWNSSVKKKLDSYLASGLLEQFQDFPLVAYQDQTIPSSSSRLQSSDNDNGQKCGIEAEEISECSQESIAVVCSQSASDLGNAVLLKREELQLTEESGLQKEQSSSPATCSEQYYTSLKDSAFSIPEIPCEVGGSSNFIQKNFSHNAVTSASGNYHFNVQELPDVSSLELEQECSQLPTHCMAASESHELANVPFQTSIGLSTSSMRNIIANSAEVDLMLISDEECCRILFSDTMNDGIISSESLARGSNMVDLGECTEPALHQSSKIKVSETDRPSGSQSYYPSRSGVLGISCSQPFKCGPSVLSADDCVQICGRERSKLVGHSFETHDQEFITSVHDGFMYTNDTANSPCDDGIDDLDLQEQPYLKESSKLVLVNNFTSGSETIQSCPAEEEPNLHIEQHDAGSLCYEPPRFPSFDIPFLSCDLIQSGDIQQEYSPLGIRQLMMSSISCITPFRLWDSPSRDDSPDALLKSAAKTFTGTPSILKKRNRDLLSPFSERRNEKKLEIDMTSNLTKEFSRLDVMFDDCDTRRSSLLSPSSNQKRNHDSSSEDKENQDPALESDKAKGNSATFLNNEVLERDFDGGDFQSNKKEGPVDTDAPMKLHPDVSSQIDQQYTGVFVEDNRNDLLLVSPDPVGFKSDRAFGPSSQTPRNLFRKILGPLSGQAIGSESPSGNPCIVLSSPTLRRKNYESHLVSATAIQSIPSAAPAENMVDNSWSSAGIENFGIFGETPLKRSIESPSAWKSPWFINSLLHGQRIDAEMSLEDIGFFMSPGDRSYDAIALMKQLSEHTASAYADALKVLGNETPETILKERHSSDLNVERESNDPNVEREKNQALNNQLENCSHLASHVSTECRILDFSECETPGKRTENGKSLNTVSFSSPASYLLKGCR